MFNLFNKDKSIYCDLSWVDIDLLKSRGWTCSQPETFDWSKVRSYALSDLNEETFLFTKIHENRTYYLGYGHSIDYQYWNLYSTDMIDVWISCKNSTQELIKEIDKLFLQEEKEQQRKTDLNERITSLKSKKLSELTIEEVQFLQQHRIIN